MVAPFDMHDLQEVATIEGQLAYFFVAWRQGRDPEQLTDFRQQTFEQKAWHNMLYENM